MTFEHFDEINSSSVHAEHLFVDLDGTLVRTDLFAESAVRLLKRNPLNLFRLAIWLMRGRAYAKAQIAQRVKIEVELLPFETQLVEHLRAAQDQGRRLILTTASHRTYAEQVAAYLGVFDEVMASDSSTNLKGARKLAAIRERVGDSSFSYAGNSASDREIWKAASSVILVNAPRRDVEKAEAQGKAEMVIRRPHSLVRAFLEEMRPAQWAKNVLIFVPLLTSHGYQDPAALIAAILAFISFSVCASGVYFINDLLDLDADRRHATKRSRPLASGRLPIALGVLGSVGLPLISFLLAWFTLSTAFFVVLLVYFVTTNAYSFILKRISTVDVITLAVLYTLRIFAGAEAGDIEISAWLMAFSVFLFVSLAYLKRYVEVSELPKDNGSVPGRGYSAADAETMFVLGVANITTAVLVLALYLTSDVVSELYRRPEVLWLLCLLLLFWGNGIWLRARRGLITGDPVVFAIKDKTSLAVGFALVVVVFLARF